MRNLVAMILMAIWPAVTSHTLLESLGIIHVARHDSGHSVKNGPKHHHQHVHHGEDPSHQGQGHHHENRGGEGEKNTDHHLFADGDYAWTIAGKTLTKLVQSIGSSIPHFCVTSINNSEAEVRPPGPAPPGAAPPLLQNTWQFSHRAAVPVRAPSTIS